MSYVCFYQIIASQPIHLLHVQLQLKLKFAGISLLRNMYECELCSAAAVAISLSILYLEG